MAEDTEEAGTAPAKSSKMPLIMGILLALVGGGGGFYAVQSGLILGDESHQAEGDATTGEAKAQVAPMPDIAFVPVDPLVISLDDQSRHLRFRAQLEVGSAYKSEVEQLMPRVVDVLNNYLRALETGDLADGGSLARIRAQMLRRVQIVTGTGRVNDLLIMEFVVN